MWRRKITKVWFIPMALILACGSLVVMMKQEKSQTGMVSQKEEVAILLNERDIGVKTQFPLQSGVQKKGFLKAAILDIPWVKKNLRSIRVIKVHMDNRLRSRLIQDLKLGPV